MDPHQTNIRRPLMVISARLRQSVSASSELTRTGGGSDQHGCIQFRAVKGGGASKLQQQPAVRSADLTAHDQRRSLVPAGSLNCASPKTTDTGLSFRRGHLSLSVQPAGFALASPSLASGPYIRRPLPHEDGAENSTAVTSQPLHSQCHTRSGVSLPRAGDGLNSASLRSGPSLQQGSAPASPRLPILSQLACKRQRQPLCKDTPINGSAGVGSCNWGDEDDSDVWDDAVSRAPPPRLRTVSAVPVACSADKVQSFSNLLQAIPDISPQSEVSRSHATAAQPVVQPASCLCPASNDSNLQAVPRHPGVYIAKVPTSKSPATGKGVLRPAERLRSQPRMQQRDIRSYFQLARQAPAPPWNEFAHEQ